MKVGNGLLSGLQQSLLDLQKLKVAEAKRVIFELKTDKKEISNDAINLQNIDVGKSELYFSNQMFNFTFFFNMLNQTELKVDGFVKEDENIIETTFTYLFQKDVVENKIVVPKNFVLFLKMKAKFEEIVSIEKNKDKEDILQFIEKLVIDIFDEFNDGINSLRTVFIDQTNFKAIARTEKEDLVRLIQSLLGTVFSFIKYKEANKNDNPKFGISIHTEKKIHEAKEYTITKLQSFSIEINQLDIHEK